MPGPVFSSVTVSLVFPTPTPRWSRIISTTPSITGCFGCAMNAHCRYWRVRT